MPLLEGVGLLAPQILFLLEIFGAVDSFYRAFYLRTRPVLRILGDMLRDRALFCRRVREGKEFFSFLAKRKEITGA